MSNLHLLLRSPYFSGWPLKMRFFSADVHRVWGLWCQRVDGRLPSNVNVIADGVSGAEDGPRGDDRVGSVQRIMADYSHIQGYLEKAAFLLDDPEDLRCQVCEVQVLPMDELVVVCPHVHCHCIAHLLCLSEKFLNDAEEPDQFVPTHGICPACKEVVKWSLMMQELTLRCRGRKELQDILRKKAKKDNQTLDGSSADKHISTGPAIDETKLSARNPPTTESVTRGGSAEEWQSPDTISQRDSPLDESWLDALEVGSGPDLGDRPKSEQPSQRTEIVIDDSDEQE